MKKIIELSDRMMALATMVGRIGCLADVGTDHGHIPIYLCQVGAVERAIAMDINEGPIRAATENIASYGLSERIERRLSDGMAKLNKGEADVVLVAGMGGSLVIHILSESLEVAKSLDYLVLQPQSDIAKVRAYLRENDFIIIDEDMVCDEGKYYPMMKVTYDAECLIPATTKIMQDTEDTFGPVLIDKKHPVLREFLNKELDVYNTIEEKLGTRREESHIAERLEEIAYKKLLVTTALESMQ